ncbi:MAG: FG-GAP-like repeat-containing protein, partial [Planctomycetota bacterium]
MPLFREHKRLAAAQIALVGVVLFGGASGCRPATEHREASTSAKSNSGSLKRSPRLSAEGLAQQGRYEAALTKIEEALLVTPNDEDALWLYAQLKAELQDKRLAAETVENIAWKDLNDKSQRLIQAFYWYLESSDFESAERSIRAAVKADPSNGTAQRLLAQLLSAQGRRQEVREPLLALIRLQSITAIELMGLVDLSSPHPLVSYELYRDPSRLSLFVLGDARMVYARNGDVAAVINNMRAVVGAFPNCLAARTFLGRVLIESGRKEEFESWLSDCPADVETQAEYWRAVGLYLQLNDQYDQAIRSYGEAFQIDPTDRQVLRGIAECLESLEKPTLAAPIRARLNSLERIFRIAKQADSDQCNEVAMLLQDLGRPLESTGWLMRVHAMVGNLQDLRPQFTERVETIRRWEEGQSLAQRRRIQFESVVGLKLNRWPAFDRKFNKRAVTKAGIRNTEQPIRFADIASDSGLQTSNANVIAGSDEHIPYLYQTTGSGLAVLDYDRDGLLDVYQAIASGKPLKQDPDSANHLFRSIDPSGSFIDVTPMASVGDLGFGQGVCVGDINQDGFPDLLVSNFGVNRVYRNQGDGTFCVDPDASLSGATWTTSMALADVTGDHLPDLIAVNYLDDPLAATRECPLGEDCTPQQMIAGRDQLFVAQPDGSFERAEDDPLAVKANYGLGVVVADFDGKPGNEIFIANDADLNHFWNPLGESSSTAGGLGRGFVESAAIRGCAVGRNGMSQACMGVASGDFNSDGKLDLHVTNFWQEPSNLFMQTASGMFSDEALKFGLHAASRNSLGFGTQAADFDNDG